MMRLFAVAFCFLLVPGCGIESQFGDSQHDQTKTMQRASLPEAQPPIMTYNNTMESAESATESEGDVAGRTQGDLDASDRKIIYTASIELGSVC